MAKIREIVRPKITEICMAKIREIYMAKNKRDLCGKKNLRDLYGGQK